MQTEGLSSLHVASLYGRADIASTLVKRARQLERMDELVNMKDVSILR